MEDSNPEDSNPGTPSAPAQFDNDDAIDAKIAALESTAVPLRNCLTTSRRRQVLKLPSDLRA